MVEYIIFAALKSSEEVDFKHVDAVHVCDKLLDPYHLHTLGTVGYQARHRIHNSLQNSVQSLKHQRSCMDVDQPLTLLVLPNLCLEGFKV